MKILVNAATDAAGKMYIFRGVSDANYSQQNEVALKSRFFSYEISEYLSKFGNIQVYEVLDSSKIFDYDDSVYEFCEEYDLMDVRSRILRQLYGVDTLRETDGMSLHDEYHSYQIVATEYLESHTAYSGIIWYEWVDDLEYQIQIWDMSILRKLSRAQAEKLISRLAEAYPDSAYSNADHENLWTEGDYWVLAD